MTHNIDIISAIIIYNPISGRGKSYQYALDAKKKLEKNLCDVFGIFATAYPGHAQLEIIPQWYDKVDLIVVVAGDGTLRDVVSGLINLKSKTCVGFIPQGNANVVARELNIPENPKEAIDVLLQNHGVLVDAGLFTTDKGRPQYFLAMLEIGRAAKVVHTAEALRRGALKRLYKFWGDIVFVIAGLLSIKTTTLNDFDLVENHQRQNGPFFSAVICSMATYSKGWAMTPDAKFNDGKLHLSASRLNTLGSYLLQLWAAYRKKVIKKNWVYASNGVFYEITSDGQLYIQADGDRVESSNTLSTEIIPSAYLILTPEIPKAVKHNRLEQ